MRRIYEFIHSRSYLAFYFVKCILESVRADTGQVRAEVAGRLLGEELREAAKD
jgi:hypothetical protein